MRKIPKNLNFLDKLHRGAVIACIGLTVYGTALIGHKVYRYFTVVKPQRELQEFQLLEVGLVIQNQRNTYNLKKKVKANHLRMKFTDITSKSFSPTYQEPNMENLVDSAPKLRS